MTVRARFQNGNDRHGNGNTECEGRTERTGEGEAEAIWREGRGEKKKRPEDDHDPRLPVEWGEAVQFIRWRRRGEECVIMGEGSMEKLQDSQDVRWRTFQKRDQEATNRED